MPVAMAKALACSTRGSAPVDSLILLRSNRFISRTVVVVEEDDGDGDGEGIISGAPSAWAAKFLSACAAASSPSSSRPAAKTLSVLRERMWVSEMYFEERGSCDEAGHTKVVLEPSDIGVQASEFPNSVDFLVPVQVERVGVAFDGDFGEGFVGVFLMWDAELVVACFEEEKHISLEKRFQ